MVKALARCFRWRKLLETGVFGTIETARKSGARRVIRALDKRRDPNCKTGLGSKSSDD
jgi:hypothetical protein